MTEPLVKKELPSYGKREEDSLYEKISDDRQYHDKWTVGAYEKEG